MTTRADTAWPPTDAGAPEVSDQDRVVLSSIAARLAARAPGLGIDAALEVLVGCYGRTAAARVQDYRFLLAERAARAELGVIGAERSAGGPAGAGPAEVDEVRLGS